MKKINVQIFYDSNEKVKSGCSSSKSCCSKKESSCSKCSGGCSNKKSGNHKCCKDNTETIEELQKFLHNSDIQEQLSLEIHDINKINILDYDTIRVMYEHDMELPYVVVDDVVRCYRKISKNLIYKDLKELIEA